MSGGPVRLLPMTAVREGRRLVTAVAGARAAHGAPVLATVRRARRLHGTRGFQYGEALRAGLLDPSVPWEQASRFASAREVARLSDRLNPAELRSLTEQRAILHPVCAALGVATPRLYGIVGRGGGWSPGPGEIPVGAAATALLLAGVGAEEFVVTPSARTHGIGARILRRDGGVLVDASGGRHTPASLAEELCSSPADLFLVQERLRNHPRLHGMWPGDDLRVARVTTFLAGDGSVQVVHAGVVGARGEAWALIDPAGGAVAAGPGAVMPAWTEVRELVRAAAHRFAPRRLIHWDVAMTDRGPVVLDARDRVDPWPGTAFGDMVRAVGRAADDGGSVRGVPAA